MSKDQILFVGTGNMGHPIAANLLRAGYRLTLADLNPEKFADLVKMGASAAGDLRDEAAKADLVFSRSPAPPKWRHCCSVKASWPR
jgi:3-hydroxyisobutyrate dehydrogenase